MDFSFILRELLSQLSHSLQAEFRNGIWIKAIINSLNLECLHRYFLHNAVGLIDKCRHFDVIVKPIFDQTFLNACTLSVQSIEL